MIYLDNAATTPLCDAAKKAIIEHLDDYGNPNSSYEFARKSRLLIEDARTRIAKCINAEPDEVYFTSGGSEADSWALNRVYSLASNIEHHAVNSVDTFCVKDNGIADVDQIEEIIKKHLTPYYVSIEVVSCMMVNNEIGTIQPIKDIAKITHDNGALFHTDAVQAVGHIPIDVKELDCDMLSVSAHKFNGPKGVGLLYIKKGVRAERLIYGGLQEFGRRGGTENVLGIVAMAAALEDAIEHMKERDNHVRVLRDKMLGKLLEIEGSHLNGSSECRVASNINIRFDGVPGARLVTLCDLCDICISAGSACNEGSAEPSHVLKAIGLSDEEALSSIRITIGHENTEEEIDTAAEIITKLVERIRNNEE